MPTLQKEINDKTKIALTILFVIIVGLSFGYLFCCDEILIESTMVTQDDGQYVKEDVFRRVDSFYLVQWVIVILLVAIVWMWRLKFGITGFVGIQGDVPNIEPRSNDEDVCEENSEAAPDDDQPSPSPADQSEVGSSPEAALDDDLPSPPLSSINQNETAPSNRAMIRGRLRHLSRPPTKQKIVSLLEEYHALTIAKVAKILGLSVVTVQNIVRDNPELFRASGKGLAQVITYAQSTENNAIQKFINSHIHEEIISDTRPAQVNQFEADAIILTEKDAYLLEVKRRYTPRVPIIKVIRELRLIASQFHNFKIHIVLIYLEKAQNEKFFYRDRALVKEVLRSQMLDLQVYLPSELEKEGDS